MFQSSPLLIGLRFLRQLLLYHIVTRCHFHFQCTNTVCLATFGIATTWCTFLVWWAVLLTPLFQEAVLSKKKVQKLDISKGLNKICLAKPGTYTTHTYTCTCLFLHTCVYMHTCVHMHYGSGNFCPRNFIWSFFLLLSFHSRHVYICVLALHWTVKCSCVLNFHHWAPLPKSWLLTAKISRSIVHVHVHGSNTCFVCCGSTQETTVLFPCPVSSLSLPCTLIIRKP